MVDGVVGAKEWKNAAPVMLPRDAMEAGAGKAPGGEVRVLWTKGGLYVSFSALDSTLSYGHSRRGDPLYEEDVFEIFLDPIGDHRQFVEIQIDPAGQTFFKNYVITATPRLTPQGRFTDEFVDSEVWRYEIPQPPGIRIATHVDRRKHAWSVEAFLPASFINRRRGGAALKPGTWRANFVRHDWDKPKGAANRHVQFLYWSPVPRGCPHHSPTLMGYLLLKSN